MARLIDADKVRNEYIHAITLEMDAADLLNMLCDIIDNAPTVDAIPKADYENRLKADMVAMLEGLNLEIDEMFARRIDYTVDKIQDLIQQKIDLLKEAKDGENNN